MLLHAGVAKVLDYRAFIDKKDFSNPLEGLFYYYPKHESHLIDSLDHKLRAKHSYYSFCTMYTLDPIPAEESKLKAKYEAMYNLLVSLS